MTLTIIIYLLGQCDCHVLLVSASRLGHVVFQFRFQIRLRLCEYNL